MQKSKMQQHKYHRTQLRDLRKKLGLNQHDFWSQVGVTQSGGSRYEDGRTMPSAVAVLVELVHEFGLDLSTRTSRKKLKATK